MKNSILIILLLMPSLKFFSQTISGIVVEKEQQTPLADVIVQYGSKSKDYIYTTSNGVFTIPEQSEDIIYFQCIGYKTKPVAKVEIKPNSKIELELSPISLNPIVISAIDADKLLDEAVKNTKANLLLDEPLEYILHFLQTKNTDTLKNEIYLNYATTLTKNDLKKALKKERIPYVFNIIDISRIQKSVTPVSELYGAEYHASHLFTFGKSENNQTSRSYSTDSTLIILEIKPLGTKESWAKGEIVINKNDMTIVSMEIESVDSLLEKLPYKKYMGKNIKVIRKVGRFQFDKQNDKYFMKECFTFYRFRTVDEWDKEEEISYFCEVEFKEFSNKNKLRRRRLSGYCQELFYFPTSTTKKFWKRN